MMNKNCSDLERVRKMSDEEAYRNALEDPDAQPVDENFFKSAVRVEWPSKKEQITLRLDKDTLDWFKARGKGYQTHINAVLKAYKDSQAARQTEDCPRP